MQVLCEVDDPGRVVTALVDAAGRGRTAERAVVAALEVSAPAAVLAELRSRAGLDGEDLSIARLLRRARGREGAARRRTNPLPRNEGFSCMHCGAVVAPADGGVQRNHCPRCLYSRHVDDVPGDRAARCGGAMAPVAVERLSTDRAVILHRCTRCGFERRNRAALGCTVQPDSLTALTALAVVEEDR